MQSNSSMAQH